MARYDARSNTVWLEPGEALREPEAEGPPLLRLSVGLMCSLEYRISEYGEGYDAFLYHTGQRCHAFTRRLGPMAGSSSSVELPFGAPAAGHVLAAMLTAACELPGQLEPVWPGQDTY